MRCRYVFALAMIVLLSPLLLACNGSDNSIFGSWEPTPGANADAARGGQLWDKWWAVNGGGEPTTTMPVYDDWSGTKSGSTTWRCKECHGWDYMGRDGAYASGSHYSGIAGVLWFC